MVRKWLLALFLISGSLSAQTLSDPTKPLPDPKRIAQNGDLDERGFPNAKVTAVFINPESKHAIINGEMLAQGEQWKGFVVAEVHANGVVLSGQQGRKEILLNNNNFIKDASNEF